MARPMPVLPLVGSTSVAPGLSTPRCSASSTMATAIRSFTLPPGLRDSTLARTRAPEASASRRRRTRGVSPIRSSTEFAILPAMTFLSPSDVIHRPSGSAPFLGAGHQISRRPSIHAAAHRQRDLLPQLGQLATLPGAVAPAVRGRVERRTAAVHGPEDGPDGDVLGRLGQVVTAGRAALGGQEPRALQG